MKQETIICDVCGRERGEGNRWFSAESSSYGPTFGKYYENSPLHICGESCAHKLLDQRLQLIRKVDGHA